MPSSACDNHLVDGLRRKMFAAWAEGNSAPPGTLSWDEQQAMILRRYPCLADDVWERILGLLPQCAELGLYRAGVRFVTGSPVGQDSAKNGEVAPFVQIELAKCPRDDDAITVTIGSFLVSGLEPVLVPYDKGRERLAEWLRDELWKRAEAEGLDVRWGFSLILSWSSYEEKTDYERALGVGGREALVAGVPAKDILA